MSRLPPRPTTSWRKELEKTLGRHKDTLVEWTLSEDEFDREFDPSYGGYEGVAFTAWGKKNVYFPLVYDGAEWIGYAPRNPCDTKMEHQGGA